MPGWVCFEVSVLFASVCSSAGAWSRREQTCMPGGCWRRAAVEF